MPKQEKLHHADHKTLRHHHNLLLLCILALFLILGFLALKYLWVKSSFYENSVKLQSGIQKYQQLNSIEDAQILATTLISLPSGNPLFRQPRELQKYIKTLSENTGRNIVVLDSKKKVLADANEGNVGEVYEHDEDGEVGKTILDAEPRAFIERSEEYPNGINQTVIQVKNASGTIVGALIVSSSNIFNR